MLARMNARSVREVLLPSPVCGLAVAPGGDTLAVLLDLDGVGWCLLLNARDGQEVHRVPASGSAFAPDGTLWAASNELFAYRPPRWEAAQAVDLARVEPQDVTTSADGRWLALRGARQIELYSLVGRPARVARFRESLPSSVHFAAGRLLFHLPARRAIAWVDLERPVMVKTQPLPPAVTSWRALPDGTLLGATARGLTRMLWGEPVEVAEHIATALQIESFTVSGDRIVCRERRGQPREDAFSVRAISDPSVALYQSPWLPRDRSGWRRVAVGPEGRVYLGGFRPPLKRSAPGLLQIIEP